MHSDPDIHQLAMALCRALPAKAVLAWRDCGGTPADFFRRDLREVYALLGMRGARRFDDDDRRQALDAARREMEFIERHDIGVVTITDEDYPLRLSQLSDAPKVLFTKGRGSLSAEKMLSIVGTRRPTAYGTRQCQAIVAATLEAHPATGIVSGLAFGIDACAHRATIDAGGSTIAVLAHGLHMIYPAAHRQLAVDIIHSGGLLVSEYPSGQKPYRQRFLERNRIVAALSDATIVVESGYRGGSLSTANLAFDLDREVFAVPGRIGDEMSEGCNKIIDRQKARPYLSAKQFSDAMGWCDETSAEPVQTNLFPELDASRKPVYEALQAAEAPMQADIIAEATGLPIGMLLTTLTEMEFEGIIVRHPGNRFSVS